LIATARSVVIATILLALSGCKSAEETCGEARAAAHTAWSGYIDPLTSEHKAASETVKAAHRALKSAVEPRIGEAANTLADQRYIPGTEGWSRGRGVVFDQLCAQDSECKKLKHDIADAQNRIQDIDERLVPALAAQKALHGNASDAKAVADGAFVDPERPALKLAQGASANAQAVCEGVAATASPAEATP
jgi:hypothetical protein